MSDTDFILTTKTYAGLSAQFPGVEVWPDEGNTEDGYSYFWLVSRQGGTVRNLAYVRRNAARLQRRTYDEQGDDLWVAAD